MNTKKGDAGQISRSDHYEGHLRLTRIPIIRIDQACTEDEKTAMSQSDPYAPEIMIHDTHDQKNNPQDSINESDHCAKFGV